MDDGARVILRHLCTEPSNQRASSVVVASQPGQRLSRSDTSLATDRDGLLSSVTCCYDGPACRRTRAARSTQPRLSPSTRRDPLLPTILRAYRSRASCTFAGAVKGVNLGWSRGSCRRGERRAGEEDYERPADRVSSAACVRVHRAGGRQAWLVSAGSPCWQGNRRGPMLIPLPTALDEQRPRLRSCITASTFTSLSVTLRTRCAPRAVLLSPPCSAVLTEFGLVGRLPLGSARRGEARGHAQETARHSDCCVAGPEHDGRRKRSR